MKFEDKDLLHLKNLIKSLDVAKYPDLKGEDIVAFYRMFVWVSELSKKIELEIQADAALASIKLVKPEIKSPIKSTKPKKDKGGK